MSTEAVLEVIHLAEGKEEEKNKNEFLEAGNVAWYNHQHVLIRPYPLASSTGLLPNGRTDYKNVWARLCEFEDGHMEKIHWTQLETFCNQQFAIETFLYRQNEHQREVLDRAGALDFPTESPVLQREITQVHSDSDSEQPGESPS